ncbi:hypothetical protein HDU79_004209 [Rhizoclosmatium sp. JEL0117]|nr:hypothetical protein HDU79_004209 [Rhizoclosmatium sp. JEL0117]
MASASIATSYFDLFHSAALTVLSRNCQPLKHDSGLPNLSRFCVEACAFLQDCIGIVCVNRSVLAGSSIVIPFDTPELMPYDIERRLAVITPHLFASIDIKLSKAGGPATSSSHSHEPESSSTESSVLPAPTSTPTIPLLPTNLPSLIKVHQLPHSSFHIRPNPVDEFIPRVLKSDGIMKALSGEAPEYLMDLSGDETSASRDQLVARFTALQKQVMDGLEAKVVVYQEQFQELERLAALYEILKSVQKEDLVRAMAAQ